MSHLRTLAVGLGVCVAIAVIGCGNGAPASSSTGSGGPCPGKVAASGLGTVAKTVDATDALVFVPAKSTIGVGQVIEFKNTGSVEHTVTFSGSLACLSDNTLDPGATWDVEFNNPGSYDYICTIHAPNMAGVLTVTGSAAPPATSASASASASPAGGATPSPSATATPTT
ncbi:MAG TPA: plastocyanin/azurin family copper-binding protein [Candidatus Saccharimonadales bacterium]|nr:plastocyanin/azurin family copper-binding protein [Candidatus Saccharimonadales bacterium]